MASGSSPEGLARLLLACGLGGRDLLCLSTCATVYRATLFYYTLLRQRYPIIILLTKSWVHERSRLGGSKSLSNKSAFFFYHHKLYQVDPTVIPARTGLLFGLCEIVSYYSFTKYQLAVRSFPEQVPPMSNCIAVSKRAQAADAGPSTDD